MKAELAKEGNVTLGLILSAEEADEKEYLISLLRTGALVQPTEDMATLILLPGADTETDSGGEEREGTTAGPSLDSGKFIG